MSYRGHVKNGTVVFDEPVDLPEGVKVDVAPVEVPSEKGEMGVPFDTFEHYRDVIGAIKGLPPDLATNHDHYLHGRPRT